MKKFASTLAKEYDFTTRNEYFDYILESLMNGNRQQCKRLFRQMKRDDQNDFLINHLKHDNGIQTSCIKILIPEI